MKRLCILLLLCLCCTAAEAQNARSPLADRWRPDNKFIFNKGQFTRSKRTLTAANPQLTSLGPGHTTILFPADGTVRGAAVTTQNFPAATSFRNPEVSNIRLHGQYIVSDGVPTPIEPVVADGIKLGGDGDSIPKVLNVEVSHFKGDGIETVSWGWVRGSYAHNCYVGINAAGADVMVTDNMASECREYCALSNGSNQTWHGNHFWGGGLASLRVTTGGFENRYTNEVYKDSPIGLLCEGYNNSFVAVNCTQNFQCCARITSVANNFYECYFAIDQDTEEHEVRGIEFTSAADRCVIQGGTITLGQEHGAGTPAGPAEYGILLAGDDFTMRDTRLVDIDGYDGSVIIKVVGAVKGMTIDVPVWMESSGMPAAHKAKDQIIVFDAAAASGMRACHFVFRGMASDGVNIDTDNIGKYIDIPAGWHSSNSITFVNTTTGVEVELTPGDAY